MRSVVAFVLSIALFGHPGRTNSSGYHKNRSTGQYHYHGLTQKSVTHHKTYAETATRDIDYLCSIQMLERPIAAVKQRLLTALAVDNFGIHTMYCSGSLVVGYPNLSNVMCSIAILDNVGDTTIVCITTLSDNAKWVDSLISKLKS